MWKEYYVAALLFLNGVWDWKKREVCLPSILVSLAAGLVGAFLVNAVPERTEYTENIYREQAQITAWWGSLYPKFCFAEKPENTKEKVKISFWLAQVLDWC